MGGVGSNRWTSEYRRRKTVDDALSFSITALRHLKLHQEKSGEGVYHWTQYSNPVSIKYSLRPAFDGGLLLDLIELTIGDKKVILDNSIRLYREDIPNGGHRWWMYCPIEHYQRGYDPRICGKKCAVLYLPTLDSQFGCRQCHDLTFRCRQKHDRNKYLERKMRKNPDLAAKEIEMLRNQAVFLGINLPGIKPPSSGGSGTPQSG